MPLEPGETRTVDIEVPLALCAFSGPDGRLIVDPGPVQVFVGSSSSDLRLLGEFAIEGTRTPVAGARPYLPAVAVRPVGSHG